MQKPFAITLNVGSSLANHTGSWRTEKPLYVDLLPPCNQACPAGENIQQWLFHAEEGNYEAAWRQLTQDNPFPAIMGRVCYHPCQTACNRAEVDEAVGINAVERFLGDEALTRAGPSSPRLPRPSRQAGPRHRGRPVGAVGGIPPAPTRARRDVRDAGPMAAA
jgi:NADPH-dependent glutamate synthase beta subunit-like oxidoreductase